MRKLLLFSIAVIMCSVTFAQSDACKVEGSYVLTFESLTDGVATGGQSVEVTKIDDGTIALTDFVPGFTINATIEDGYIYIEPQEVGDGLTIWPIDNDKAYADEPAFVAVDDKIMGLYSEEEGALYILTPYAIFDQSGKVSGLAYSESAMTKANGKMTATSNSGDEVAYNVCIQQSNNLVYVTNFGNHGQTLKIELSYTGSFTANFKDAENMPMWDDVDADYNLMKYNGRRGSYTLQGSVTETSLVVSDEGNGYGWGFTASGAPAVYYLNTVISYTTDQTFGIPEAPAAMPASPSVDGVGAYDDEEEHTADIEITVNPRDDSNNSLDTRYLYYKVYTQVGDIQETLKFNVNGEETDVIPYGYESEDIRARNTNGGRYVTVYFDPKKTVERFGVQSIYTAGGEENITDVTWGSYIARLISLDAQGWSTFSGTNVLDFAGTDATAYTVRVSGNKALLTSVPKVPSRTGIIIKGNPGEDVLIPVGSGRVTLADNDLVASVNQTTVEPNSVLVLGEVDGVEVFYTYTGNEIPAGKAYLKKTEDMYDSLVLQVDGDDPAPAQGERTVTLQVAGTLADYITDDEKYDIVKLTVNGPVNGKDFVLMRDMAGCKDINTYTDGALEVLDLSGATIVASDDVYFSYAGWSYTTDDNVLGQYIMLNADLLQTLILPENLVEIGDQALSGCQKLAGIDIPQSVTTIGMGAFLLCNSIESITVPDAVTTLRTGSFQRMSGLREIYFGKGITELDNSIFLYDTKLEVVGLGSNIQTFEPVVFTTLTALKRIEVPGDNPYFTSADGVLFDKQQTELVIYPTDKDDTSYDVPASVQRIGDCAFQMSRNLKTVHIPSSVLELGNEAFSGAVSLVDINIDEGLRSIGDYAFGALEVCTSVTLPASVTQLGMAPFYMSNSLENIYVAEASQDYSCDDGILYSKDGATLVAFPTGRNVDSYATGDQVTAIADYAFMTLAHATEVNLTNVRQIGDFAFYYCQELQKVTLGPEVEHIGTAAFMDCEKLQQVTCHPAALSDVDPDAFINEGLIDSGRLIVPAGTTGFYLAQPWVTNQEYGVQTFCYIEEMGDDGLSDPHSATGTNARTETYSIDGTKALPRHGIVIVRQDGKTRKVIR